MSRRPWLAAVLSVLLPGLGQVYNRQVGKAALFFVGYIVPMSRYGGLAIIRRACRAAPGVLPKGRAGMPPEECSSTPSCLLELRGLD